MTPPFAFDNSYARLPDRFFQRVRPTPVAAPRVIDLNHDLAAELGVDSDALTGPAGAAILGGNSLPPGADPLAMAYAGHQFGNFVPQLGDGRAILLGEVIDRQGRRRDIQLKGGGPTAFSRRGDGRAALGPVLREYLVSEAMAAFGIPTTRALAATATGDQVFRDTILPGAVLTRVAASHIRVGTFQFFAVRGDVDGLKALADHAIARHYPDAAAADHPYRAFLDGVVAAQAALVAQWQLVGFIHGVMNTDNCAISGETIDYGPCAFMDVFDAATVFSSIDERGRYAYGNQPRIARWNLARLAECLLPLLADGEEDAVAVAEVALDRYAGLYEAAYLDGMRGKLGLLTAHPDDPALIRDLLRAMTVGQADFTLTFRRLSDVAGAGAGEAGTDDAAVTGLFAEGAGIGDWLASWRQRLTLEPAPDPARRLALMRRRNPVIIPRNHRIEAVIQAAVDHDDFAPFHDLLAAVRDPTRDRPEFRRYETPPRPDERVLRTFCGT